MLLQHKVFRLLSHLNPAEFKGFYRFLQSPFFNNNARIILLFGQLKKYYPDFDNPKLTREKLYKKTYPGKKYHYQQFANLLSEFNRLTEEYFAQLAFKKDAFQRRKKLIESYGQKNLHDLLEKETFAYLKEFPEFGTTPDHHQKYMLLYDWYFHPLTEKNRSLFRQVSSLAESLDTFYLQAKLLLTVELKNRNGFLKEEHQLTLLPGIKAIAKQKIDQPNIYIYYLLLQLIEQATDENYHTLKAYFIENSSKVGKKLSISSFRLLNNYCLKSIRDGAAEFAKEHLNLYEIGMEQELLVLNQTITPFTYLNAITSGILCYQFEWIKKFIDKYQHFLVGPYKQETIKLGDANVAFAEEDFELVTDIINSTKFNILRYNISAKALLARAYFEIAIKDDSYFEIFTYNLSSFTKFLQRVTNLDEQNLKGNQNLVSLLSKFHKLLTRPNLNILALESFLANVKKTKPLSSESWLITRVEKVKQKMKT